MTERTTRPSLGLVIPCFNEEAMLPKLFAELDLFAKTTPGPVWFLFVNDGSRDRTADLLDAACARDERMACVHFSRNFGHQAAVSAGLQLARGDVVAVIDADLQDPPAVILEMIAKWQEGYDVVYGVRHNRKEGFLLRLAYAAFYRTLQKVANVEIPLDAGDFSLLDRRVVEQINRLPEHNRFVRGLRGWVGFRQYGLTYDRSARQAGETKYNLGKLVKLAMDGLITFSSVPLRLASWLGALSALLGVVFFIYALYSRFFRAQTPTGWTSLVVLFLFFGGMQLLVLGIVGEYVGRIFEEVKNRPHYVEAGRSGWLMR